MNFITTTPTSFPITIDGVKYTIPFMTKDDWIERINDQTEETIATSTADMDEDQRARFLLYFNPPLIDGIDMLRWALTFEGIAYVLTRQLKVAGVPDETVKALLQKSPPRMLHILADKITQAKVVIMKAENATRQEGETSADPLTGAGAGSEGSQPTAPASKKADSQQHTLDATPAS